MSDELDERLGQLLRQDAPPRHDPAFRISLIERREQLRYQRRQQIVLASAALLALMFIVAVSLVQLLGSRPWATALAVIFGSTVIVASLVSVVGVLQVIRRLRGHP